MDSCCQKKAIRIRCQSMNLIIKYLSTSDWFLEFNRKKSCLFRKGRCNQTTMSQVSVSPQQHPQLAQDVNAPRKYRGMDRFFCIVLPVQAIAEHSRDHLKILICGLAFTIKLVFSSACSAFTISHLAKYPEAKAYYEHYILAHNDFILKNTVDEAFSELAWNKSPWNWVSTATSVIVWITMIVVAWQTVSCAKKEYNTQILGRGLLMPNKWPGRTVQMVDWITAIFCSCAGIALHGNNRASVFFSWLFYFSSVSALSDMMKLFVMVRICEQNMVEHLDGMTGNIITVVGIMIGALAWTAAANSRKTI